MAEKVAGEAQAKMMRTKRLRSYMYQTFGRWEYRRFCCWYSRAEESATCAVHPDYRVRERSCVYGLQDKKSIVHHTYSGSRSISLADGLQRRMGKRVTTGATLEEGSYESGSALDWTGSLIGSVCTSFDWRSRGGGNERCGGRDKGGCRRLRGRRGRGHSD